jgi:pilus assembly protein CpaB
MAMTRRGPMLVLSLLVALLGTGAVFAYVSKVNSRAEADLAPVTVLVAKQQIPSGTSLHDAEANKLFAPTSMPRKAVPEGALKTVGSLGAMTAVSDVFAGEVLLRPKFADGQTTGALVIPDGAMAMSVELTDPERVGGFVVPGSYVAIFDTYDTGAGGKADKTTRMLLPRVKVIGVGSTSTRTDAKAPDNGSDAKPVAATVLTVAVNKVDAERLAHAVQTGDLYFALLSRNSATGPTSGITASNLFR